LNKQISNKRETTYKIVKNDEIVEYHLAQSHCWRYGMVKPKIIKTIAKENKKYADCG
jgi:hypothetical protein